MDFNLLELLGYLFVIKFSYSLSDIGVIGVYVCASLVNLYSISDLQLIIVNVYEYRYEWIYGHYFKVILQ